MVSQGTRETGDLLDIDQHILKEGKARRKNVTMAWIDYKKASDIVQQTQIIECLKMYKISNKIIKFIMEVMKNWKIEVGGENPEKCVFAIIFCNSNGAFQLHI